VTLTNGAVLTNGTALTIAAPTTPLSAVGALIQDLACNRCCPRLVDRLAGNGVRSGCVKLAEQG